MILKMDIGSCSNERDQIMIYVDGGSGGALPGPAQEDLY